MSCKQQMNTERHQSLKRLSPEKTRKGLGVRLGTVVLLHGTVEGMGQTAECEVLARRIIVPPDSQPDGRRFYTYTDCSVIGAPFDLPEGEYLVHFEEYTFKATCQRGLWLSCGPATRNPEVPVFDD